MLEHTILVYLCYMKENHTIKDIANLAGVSKGTVDRVLHKRGKVSAVALKKVRDVLSEIDYQPNLIARNLKNTKVYRICVLLPDPTFDPYWMPCIDGIEEAINNFKSFNVIVETHFFNPLNTQNFIEINEIIITSKPDAVLLVPLFQKESITVIEKYNSLGIITSIFNNHLQATSIKAFVGQDLDQSGRLAARLFDLLLKDGSIAVIHIDEVYENAVFMQEKEKGFRSYFLEKENSIFEILTCKIKNPTINSDFTSFLDKHPNITGIFVTTSKAYQIAKLLQHHKNKNIELIGYDLVEKNIEYLTNKTISFLIHQNPKRQIYLGITSLIEHFIFGKEIPNEQLLPIDIITSENLKSYL